MATTQTDEHGLVSIFEPVECTLYNYVHEQGERISIREIARFGMTLADTLKYCHMRGYVHGALSSHCIYFTPDGTVKIGGWEMAVTENVCSSSMTSIDLYIIFIYPSLYHSKLIYFISNISHKYVSYFSNVIAELY